jgi:hypothetical protein
VNAAKIDKGDIEVIGPGNTKPAIALVSKSQTTNGSPITVTYRLTPKGGFWSADDSGNYRIRLKAKQVFDTKNNTHAAAVELGSFNVVIPDAGNTRPTALDLGALGALISHNEHIGSPDSYDYFKFTVTQQSNVRFAALAGLKIELQLQDSKGKALNTASGVGTIAINRPLAAGTYYLRVRSLQSPGTYYTLQAQTV